MLPGLVISYITFNVNLLFITCMKVFCIKGDLNESKRRLTAHKVKFPSMGRVCLVPNLELTSFAVQYYTCKDSGRCLVFSVVIRALEQQSLCHGNCIGNNGILFSLCALWNEPSPNILQWQLLHLAGHDSRAVFGSNPIQGMDVWYVYVFILCLCSPVFR
jgi:hypothetical protein